MNLSFSLLLSFEILFIFKSLDFNVFFLKYVIYVKKIDV